MAIRVFNDLNLNNQNILNAINGAGGNASSGDHARISKTLAAQSLASGTTVAVTFDTVDYDSNSLVSGNSIVIAKPGLYFLNASLSWGASTDSNRRELNILVNSSVVAQSILPALNSAASGTVQDATGVFELTAGDVVTVSARHEKGSALDLLNSGPGCFLEVIGLGGSGSREVLTANRTYYVDPAGSDSNDGLTPGTAFQTIQKAVDVVSFNLEPQDFSVTIQLADGTYSNGRVTLKKHLAGGSVTIRGNNSDKTLVVIDNASPTEGFTIYQSGTCCWTLQDLTLTNNALSLANSLGRNCIYLESGASMFVDNCKLLGTDSQTRGIGVYANSSVQITNLEVEGSWRFILVIVENSVVKATNTTLTIVSGTNFAFFLSSMFGSTYDQVNLTVTGSATGGRYSANGLCIIRTTNALDSDVPGSAAGTLLNGSILV